MAVKPVVYDDSTKKHRPLGSGEKMDGLSASSIISSQSGNLITTGSDGLAYATGSGIIDPAADNLLEATSGGKVKMDVDRLAEWLDGHPADAKALSEAIKVVSGDSGNLIQKGSDKGAYMSSAQLAAAIAGLSAAQLQSLLAAFADGQTIVVSGGKLVVDPTTAPKAKLQAITTAIRKAGGGLAVDSATGKLVVNFGEIVDPDAISDILDSLIDFGGGLAKNQQRYLQAGDKWVDSGGVEHTVTAAQAAETPYGFPNPNYNKLIVDFSRMPTDKFEKMLKALKMLVPLDSNKTLYVSVNNVNAVEPSIVGGKVVYPDGCGTSDKPFKKIQDCVNYLTGNYSLGRYNAYIRIVAGTYNENVSLPEYSRGSGTITIMSDSGSRDVTVKGVPVPNGRVGTPFAASGAGAVYNIRYISTERVEAPTTGKNQVACCVSSSSNALLRLYGCSYRQSFPNVAAVPSFGGNNFEVRVIAADSGGTIYLHHSPVAHVLSSEVNPYAGVSGEVRVPVHPFVVARGGTLWFTLSYDEDNDPVTTGEFSCSGSCDVFITVWQGGSTNTLAGGNPILFTGTMTGKRFEVTGGSHIKVPVSSNKDTYFPGDVAGTVDDGTGGRPNTFCWYA